MCMQSKKKKLRAQQFSPQNHWFLSGVDTPLD